MNKDQNQDQDQDQDQNIRGEDTFTISARNIRLRIKDIQDVLRLAIYRANNRSRVETYAWFFGDGLLHKRSRSFHVAITRPLNDEERFCIEQFCKQTAEKAGWGNPDVFFRWGLHLKDSAGRYSTDYLDNHPQKWCVKVSNGQRKEEKDE